MAELSVLILTHNEESNIEKCIRSILPVTERIYIVDSGSTDSTVDRARSLGAVISTNAWINYASQFNWGLDRFSFETPWVMRMDADEVFTADLVRLLPTILNTAPADVAGFYVRRRVHFMGRWIRHGGYYPTWLLRVFRTGLGRCEPLWMDEHIVLSEGSAQRIYADIIDDNRKDLTFWTDKHNRYASREVLDIVGRTQGSKDAYLGTEPLGTQAHRRRWTKLYVYGYTPLFIRAFIYFLYRYFLRFGFLDGREGLIFHTLQGFWYRFLVDAKLYETLDSKKRPAASL